MKDRKQLKYFNVQLKFLYTLGVWPKENGSGAYALYSKIFILVFILFYDSLLNLNLFFMPRILDNYIEELVFYFTEASVMSKVLTFYLMKDELRQIMDMLQSHKFQPTNKEENQIVAKARKFNSRYWNIIAVVSCISHVVHTIPPVILYYLGFGELRLLICSYSFLSEEFRQFHIQPLYFYQIIGMHFHMWYNVNVDTFFLGLIILIIAQLEMLQGKLRKITDGKKGNNSRVFRGVMEINESNDISVRRLNESVLHFEEVAKFCALIQQVFSVTLFIQFSVASCIICICLFRFTMLASLQYYIFLATYMFIMIVQILVPCWFGTQIIEKSYNLSQAIYDCDWVPMSRRFKSSMRIFVVRMNRPLTLCGWKLFPLSLITFTSIINTAYSFFTLLRHMQMHDQHDK